MTGRRSAGPASPAPGLAQAGIRARADTPDWIRRGAAQAAPAAAPGGQPVAKARERGHLPPDPAGGWRPRSGLPARHRSGVSVAAGRGANHRRGVLAGPTP